MSQLPRIAFGTVEEHELPQFVLWAIMNVLDQCGLQVQSFCSQSRCDSRDAALAITGTRRRHLDSWLMQPDICTEVFYNAAVPADIAIVDGAYDAAYAGRVADAAQRGGSLDTLCEWLDLPRIVVLDAEHLQPCRLPTLPRSVAGIVLDNVSSAYESCRLQTHLEALFGVPVLGAMRRHDQLRAAIANLASDEHPNAALCNRLGSALAPHFQLERFLEIASARRFSRVESDLFRDRMLATPLNIAIAHDEAFDCYFRDTLDVLESQGARLNVFSPLRSESLPVGTDVVYLGGGSLERHANDLASNVCLKESLWGHVIGGGRIYAECAGLAYLCREMILPGDHSLPMVGLLPAVARRHVCPEPERAVEIVTQRESWLFPSRQSVRGYLNSNWCIEPEGCFAPSPVDAKRNHDLIGDYQIVGSRLRLNFAARPDCLDRFFQPFDRAGLNTVS